jgi:hypothetical protein
LPDRAKLGLVAALLMAGSMWFYVQRVLIPYQQADAARHDRPRGNLSDLYPRWLGARELLLHHRNPYRADVTQEIQAGYYGRPLDPTRPNDPKDQQGFAYPAYVVFLLAPTIQLPFAEVQAAFRWLLVLLIAASVPLWLHAIGWRPSRSTFIILLALTLGSFAVAQGIKLQQLSLLVSFLIAGVVALLSCGYLAIAGGLLAFATIKPQLALPLAAWLTLWSLSDWRRRWHFPAAFYLTLGFLIAAAEYELPGWIAQFREAVSAYGRYTGGSRSLLDVLLSQSLGRIAAGLVTVAVAYFCWKKRNEPYHASGFAFSVILVLAATLVIIPTFAPYNQVLLLPAVFWLARSWNHLRQRGTVTRTLTFVMAALLIWPWLAAASLSVATFFLPAAAVQQLWAVPLYTSLGIPLGVLAVLASVTTSSS